MQFTNVKHWARGPALLLGLALCAAQPASALDRDDTMSAWRQSTDEERSRVLDQLQAGSAKLRHVDRKTLMACLNGAGAFPQHGDFRIGDLAEACADPDAPSGNDI